MALPLSQTVLPFAKPTTLATESPPSFSNSFSASFQRSRTKCMVLNQSNSTKSASSAIPDAQKANLKLNEQQKERKEETTDNKVAEVWREIQGQNDWNGLLDPLDPILRSEIIRYGEMTQACYDAFDSDPFSRYCGSCRFCSHEFFEQLEMLHHGYEVSRYTYATSDIKVPSFFVKPRWPKEWTETADWIGYVAVSNDETSKRLGRRDISIVWRGTVTKVEWVADMMFFMKPVKETQIPCPEPNVRVEAGFVELYTDKDTNCRYCKYSAREQVLSEVKRLLAKYPNEEVSITVMGHSLGGALAVLSAYDIAETAVNKTDDGRNVPVTVFTFGAPRVGSLRFKERVEELGVKILRVANEHDVVPNSPGVFFNEKSPGLMQGMMKALDKIGQAWGYWHVGATLEVDFLMSPFLKPTTDAGNSHNMEAYLHVLNGFHGKGRKFEPTTDRDPALVNKSCDFLKDEHKIPPEWKQYENKGIVRTKEGRYIQPPRLVRDDHPPDIHHHLHKLGLVSHHHH